MSKAYQDFIFYRTYSRFLDSEKRRETWEEAVQRYMDFMKSKVGTKISKKDYKDIHEAILKQEVMPSMRLLWSAGEPAERCNVTAYNCSFIAPTKWQDFAEILYLLTCGCGVGYSVESKFVEKLPDIQNQDPKKERLEFAVPDSKEGWADSLALGLKTWASGGDIELDYSKIRPAGARLKTMGGRASGAEPLKNLLTFTREKMLSRQGSHLRTIDVHDIICKIGEVVVAGGVRRSAQISLSDLNDKDLRDAKKGAFYYNDPQRSMANNSAVYEEKPPIHAFMKEWLALMESGSGERGIFNRGNLPNHKPERRELTGEEGTNPCYTGDTLIPTKNGVYQMRDLVGKRVQVHDGNDWVEIDNFRVTAKNQEVLKITLHDGSEIKATPYHRFILEDDSSVEAKDLQPDDRLKIKEVESHGNELALASYLKGFLVGDGTHTKDRPILWLYDTKYMCEERLKEDAESLTPTVRTNAKSRVHFIQSTHNRKMMQGLGARKDELFKWTTDYKKRLPREVFVWDKQSKANFIAGVMDADGTASDTKNGFLYQLSSINRDWLLDFQNLLKTFGVRSTLRQNKEACQKDFGDGYGKYRSKPCYRLTISQIGAKKLASEVEFSRLTSFAGKQISYNLKPRFNKIVSVEPWGTEDKVYCCTVHTNNNMAIQSGILAGQCGEITLRNKEFCNLTEVVARPSDTTMKLLEKVRLATILGTYQSSLTNFNYLSKDWKKNCEEERLLGVSITGMWDCKNVRNPVTLEAMKEHAVSTNKRYSKKLGISPSASITCIKPSGTVSQLVDASSGMHPRYSPFYIRRVRISASDPLLHLVRECGMVAKPEVGQAEETATTFVLEFPMKAPKDAKTANGTTAVDQLEFWKLVKDSYTEHNPSQTVYVGDDEWLEVGSWIWKNWDIVGGLSFLPKTNHIYELAPYEEIDEKTYKEMVSKLPRIDFSKLSKYEQEDNTSSPLACEGTTCEIK